MKDELADAIAAAISQHLFAAEPIVYRRITREEINVIADQAAASVKKISKRRAKTIAFPRPTYATYRNISKRHQAARVTLRKIK